MAGDSKVGPEWISISDLMSGVVGIMVLLFVCAALKITTVPPPPRCKGDAPPPDEIAPIFGKLQKILDEKGMGEFVDFNVKEGRIKLRDATFGRCSVYIDESTMKKLSAMERDLHALLAGHPSLELFIEGHTDSLPVQKSCDKGALIHDNYLLSAIRAGEARNALVADWPEGLKRRVFISGFGDSRLLPGKAPESTEQRRVEIMVRQM